LKKKKNEYNAYWRNWFRASDIPERFWDKKLKRDILNLKFADQNIEFDDIYSVILNAWKNNKNYGLFFIGNKGNGKTLTAVTIMKKLLFELEKEDRQKIGFIDLSNMLFEYKQSWNGSFEQKAEIAAKLQKVKKVPVLVIDEFFRHYADWQHETIDLLLKYRDSQSFITIITSNNSMSDIVQKINSDEDEIISILGSYDSVEFLGKDRRIHSNSPLKSKIEGKDVSGKN
jgi:DNA replication protein DnaC